MDRWLGRVALVTGASAGFGEAIARRLVQHGMKVIGCAIDVDKIQHTAESLKDAKGSLLAVQCDVTKEDQILSMFEKIKTHYGGVDVCINNAGLGHDAPLLTGQTEQWRNMFEVNVIGLSVCTREAVKSMRERGVDDGHIIHIGSMTGHYVYNNPTLHMYSATKYAIRALTDGLRNELVALKSHIRVTCLSPGLASTDFLRKLFSDNTEKAAEVLSIYQPLLPEDIVCGIMYALEAPPRVQVHDVLIHPTEATYPT